MTQRVLNRSHRLFLSTLVAALIGAAGLLATATVYGARDDGPPPPPPRNDRDGPPPREGDAAKIYLPEEQVEPNAPKGTVIVRGGHDTDPRDHGRPVKLIGEALGVGEDKFREAFSGVHPAGPGRGPTDGEARANKAALMKVLAPLGVTDERLNEVSNYYRYQRQNGELWKHKPAKLTTQVVDGKVTGIKIDDAGAGYMSPPAITVVGFPDVKAIAEIAFGTDLATNGSIKAVTLQK